MLFNADGFGFFGLLDFDLDVEGVAAREDEGCLGVFVFGGLEEGVEVEVEGFGGEPEFVAAWRAAVLILSLTIIGCGVLGGGGRRGGFVGG